MIMAALKQHTKKAHNHIENQRFAKLLLNKPTLEQYLSILQCWYGLYNAYYCAAEQFRLFSKQLLSDRIEQLTADMLGLGSSRAVIHQLPRFESTITNLYQAHGMAYVLEGSCLGGQVICRCLKQRAASAIQQNTRFYFGYGDATQQHWRCFCQYMESQELTGDQMQMAVDSANATFAEIEHWFILNQ